MTPLKPFGPTPYYNKREVLLEENKQTKRKGKRKAKAAKGTTHRDIKRGLCR